MADKVTPSSEHEKLLIFEGSWEGEQPSPKGKWRGRLVMRRGLDGLFIVQDYVQERNGKPEYSGHGVVGFDPAAKRYTWYWVDTMGTVADVLRGEWEGQTLRFVGRSPKGEARYSYRFEGNDRLHYTIENKTNGAWTVARSWSYDRRLSMS